MPTDCSSGEACGEIVVEKLCHKLSITTIKLQHACIILQMCPRQLQNEFCGDDDVVPAATLTPRNETSSMHT